MNYATKAGQRIYSKTISGVFVRAWRADSCSFIVKAEGESIQSFDSSKWGMAEAMEFYVELMS